MLTWVFFERDLKGGLSAEEQIPLTVLKSTGFDLSIFSIQALAAHLFDYILLCVSKVLALYESASFQNTKILASKCITTDIFGNNDKKLALLDMQ